MSRLTTLLLTTVLAAPGLAAHAAQIRQQSGLEASAGTTGAGISMGSDLKPLEGGAQAASGGVGLNARDDLRARAPDHNVKMVFALTTGNYVADVQVKVMDRSGKTVVDGVSDGPWMYAKLPPGSYTARATYGGHTRTQKFTVGRSGTKTAHFRWPASVEREIVTQAGDRQVLETGKQPGR